MSSPASLPGRLPAELLDSIFRLLYDSLQLSPSLDADLKLRPPLVVNGRTIAEPRFEQSSYDVSLRAFSNACLVCKAWAEAAQPYLFRHVRIEAPRAFESLLEAIAEPEEEGEERIGRRPGPGRFGVMTPPRSRTHSRSPTRARQTDRYPSIDDAINRLRVVDSRGSGGSDMSRTSSVSERPDVPPSDRLPGLWIERLTFSSFRTIGMRRTIREGSQQRFVTTDRVLRLLQGTRGIGILSTDGDSTLDADYDLVPDEEEWGQLKGVGMTEYMDSALQREVLDEILLRGGVETGSREAPRRTGSPAALACTPIVALDLNGCVSRRFIEGLSTFAQAHQLGTDAGIRFPYLRRLGLHSVTVPPELLTDFVGSFPRLTHLDLSHTRAGPQLLEALTNHSGTMELISLSLARCKGVTSESIRDLLCGEIQLDGKIRNVTASLRELSLFGDETTPTPLTPDHLAEILSNAPCFNSGRLRFLDVSSLRFTDELLSLLPPQPSLVGLGFADIRSISLAFLSSILATKAPQLEVLNLKHSCMATGPIAVANILALHQYLVTGGPARLRVIELDEATLRAIKGGAGTWKVVWGKGRRGYYVDTAAKGAEVQRALMAVVKDERLTPSTLGWHVKKMEVLAGHGMFGREDGLYSFHALQV